MLHFQYVSYPSLVQPASFFSTFSRLWPVALIAVGLLISTVNKKETEASSAKTANATKVTSTTDKTTKSSPKTGDSTDVQLYVILMLVSIGAAAGAGAKRKLKTQR